MKKLIILTLLLISFNAYAVTYNVDPATETLYRYTQPTHRTNNALLKAGDIARYKVYLGTVPGIYSESAYTTELSMAFDNAKKAGSTYYLAVTAIDSIGRESDFSPPNKYVVASSDSTPPPIVPPVDPPADPPPITPPPMVLKPATITGLKITRITEKGLRYRVLFDPVTEFEDGTPLPIGAVTKYFLFFSDVWKADIRADTTRKSMVMDVGVYSVEIETEIYIDGKYIVSERSVAQTLEVKAYVPPPVVPPCI